MTAMDSAKSRMNNKKRKNWVYFTQNKKKLKLIKKSTSPKPSETDDTILPQQSSIQMEVHKKRNKKGKHLQISENDKTTLKDKVQGSNQSTSASIVTNKTSVNKPKKLSAAGDESKSDSHVIKSSKSKQQRKKRQRKLRILRRKEKERKLVKPPGSSNQKNIVTTVKTKKPKKESENETSKSTCVASDGKGMDPDVKIGVDKESMSRKRKRKNSKASKKRRKRQIEGDGEDSGLSSGMEETPHLPEDPQDVASNWKALASKLKLSAPKKPKKKNRNASDNDSREKDEKIWFDGVDPALLEEDKVTSGDTAPGGPVGDNKITRCVGLDCEMVGIGHEGKDSILARVSMVNEYGQCIYDKFVKPREKVTDFRTEVSGVRPKDLFQGNAEEFLTVQKEVSDIMKDRILVGHALKNDMKVLFLGHPRRLMRDTATYPHFRELMKTKRPALKKLAKTVLGVTVQEGEHNSIEDAQTAMRLYTLHKTAWEKSLKQRGKITKKST